MFFHYPFPFNWFVSWYLNCVSGWWCTSESCSLFTIWQCAFYWNLWQCAFTFNVIVDVLWFASTILLFASYLFHLLFIPFFPLFLPSFYYFYILFYILCWLISYNFILLFYDYISVYTMHLWLITVYLQVILYHFIYRIKILQYCGSIFLLSSFMLWLSYILLIHML